jgi:AcrR family transcriptional regulator
VGIQERKEREREQRRLDIVNAAERVFAKKGFGDVTMDDVAEEAELSKGTLYLYFKTNEELHFAVAARGLEVLGDMFARALEIGETGLHKVRAVGSAYSEFFHAYPTYHAAVSYYSDAEVDWDDHSTPNALACHDQGDKVLGLLTRAIEIGMQDGTLRDDLNPTLTGLWLWTQTSGLLQFVSTRQGEHLAQEYGVSKQELIEASFELAQRAIAK